MRKLFKVVKVKAIGDFRLHIKFDDGLSGDLDLFPLVTFDGVFEPLKNPVNFADVDINEFGILCWPNNLDMDTENLHDWMGDFGINLKYEKGKKFKIKVAMPNISRFLGITITMQYNEGKHELPHFHANYGEENISIAIGTWKILAGKLSSLPLKYVIKWAKLHQTELESNWKLCKSHLEPKPIDPLK